MKTLISDTLIRHLGPQFSSPKFVFHFPSLSLEHPKLLNFSPRKWLYHPKSLTLCSASATGSVSFGGWDDPRIGGGSEDSSESNQIRNLLNSLGIDDKRYMFMYLVGFICALAISRIRVSSMVVFPACVLVFAVGFSIGFFNGGHVNELSLIETKRKPKEETLNVSVEKLRNLVDLFDGFGGKISSLTNDIKRGIQSSHITVGDLESYVNVIDSIGLSVLDARSVLQACVDSISVGSQEVERTSNQKSTRRKKEVGEMGFDFLHFIGGLFQESSVGSNLNKVKDSVKRDATKVEVNNQSRGNTFAPAIEEKDSSVVPNDKAGNRNAAINNSDIGRDAAEKFAKKARRNNLLLEHDKMKISGMDRSVRRVLDGEQYSYQYNRLQFVNNQQISLNMGRHHEVGTWESNNEFLDSLDFSVNLNHMDTEASFERDEILHKTNGSYRLNPSWENRGKKIYESRRREEERVISKDDPYLADHPSGKNGDVGSSDSSSMISDDIVFNRYLIEANALLKEARECLIVNGDEGHVETVLYKSAKLLSKAIEMKPMSLLAVGQLGNTYLLHGELKLKTSRQLRALLAKRDPMLVQKRGKSTDEKVASQDKIASLLINVCEDCEELLVEAGRKYRLALSIDGNDMRALYNWGLALSFRAQLLADIGPEAAFDADKVFLAAIDKFDAMMSKSNAHTPDALFRWGVALQQRSRLRPRNSKEKVKLLQQAKRLYEDALDMDSDNLQVREALGSCISELNFRSY